MVGCSWYVQTSWSCGQGNPGYLGWLPHGKDSLNSWQLTLLFSTADSMLAVHAGCYEEVMSLCLSPKTKWLREVSSLHEFILQHFQGCIIASLFSTLYEWTVHKGKCVSFLKLSDIMRSTTKSNQSKPIDYRIVSCCLQLVVSIVGKQVHGLEFSLSLHQISKSLLKKTSPQIDSDFLDDLFFIATLQAQWDKVVNYANICSIKMYVIVAQQYMFSLQMCPIQISCIMPRKYL